MAAQAEKATWQLEVSGEEAHLQLKGCWEVRQHRLPAFQDVLEEARQSGSWKRLRITAEELGEYDSGLLVFLLSAVGEAEQSAKDSGEPWELHTSDLPAGIRNLLKLATAVPERETNRGEKKAPLVRKLGTWAISVKAETMAFVSFVGETILSIGRLLRGKAKLRREDFLLVLEEVSSRALGIVALIAFLVGLIIAFLGAVVLMRFGAEYYVSYLVGYGMLREMGAVMTGIIMAGRTGAAFAAQIGSMKVTEEIDALRTLGISPIDFIVLPRVLTLCLMMPFLTVYADIIGIFGGFLVAISMFDLPAEQFFQGMLTAVGVNDFLLGVFKGSVFGVLVAISGCLRGMQSGNSADAVGLAATSAVVTGITLIIFANAIIDWMAAMLNI